MAIHRFPYQFPFETARAARSRFVPRRWLFPLTVVVVAALFVAAPWPFAAKAHAALHGLCAQRPSHSLTLGGERLPFDARMTGIYGGFFVTALYLLARGRFRCFEVPSRLTMAVLALFVGVMAVDGFNSFLVDVHAWHPYAPRNDYRLATGLLTGIALAVAVCVMLSTTLWRTGRRRRVVRGMRELGLLLLLQLPFALLARSGLGWLYVPISTVLLVSATTVVASLMLVIVVIVRHGDRVFTRAAQLQVPATLALILGIAVMAALAGGRFWLEHVTHTPPLR